MWNIWIVLKVSQVFCHVRKAAYLFVMSVGKIFQQKIPLLPTTDCTPERNRSCVLSVARVSPRNLTLISTTTPTPEQNPTHANSAQSPLQIQALLGDTNGYTHANHNKKPSTLSTDSIVIYVANVFCQNHHLLHILSCTMQRSNKRFCSNVKETPQNSSKPVFHKPILWFYRKMFTSLSFFYALKAFPGVFFTLTYLNLKLLLHQYWT